MTRLSNLYQNDTYAYFNLGIAYNKLEMFLEAIDTFKKAINKKHVF